MVDRPNGGTEAKVQLPLIGQATFRAFDGPPHFLVLDFNNNNVLRQAEWSLFCHKIGWVWLFSPQSAGAGVSLSKEIWGGSFSCKTSLYNKTLGQDHHHHLQNAG